MTLIFVVLFVSGCVNSTPPTSSNNTQSTPQSASMIECDSRDCFIEHLLTCTPARFDDQNPSLRIVSTVEGVSGNDCIQYYVVTESTYPFAVGADLRCKLPKEYWAIQEEYMKDKSNREKYCVGRMLELS